MQKNGVHVCMSVCIDKTWGLDREMYIQSHDAKSAAAAAAAVAAAAKPESERKRESEKARKRENEKATRKSEETKSGQPMPTETRQLPISAYFYYLYTCPTTCMY
ncbi:hypothetical protein ACJQWK_05261 [Exserohilum turcicum]